MLTTLKHVYCNKCGSYLLHAKNGTNDMVTCSERESVVSCSHMVKMVVHFLYLSQLRTLFEKTHLWQHMTPDNCDIADGTEYNKLNINFPHSSSLTCNAEGIAVLSSSNSTLWSVYFTIKELPVILRHIHTILNALWTVKCKPQKDTLLHCLRKSLPQWKICLTLVFIGPRMLQFSTPRFTSAFFLATVLHVHCCKTNQFNGGVWLRVVSESGIHDKQRTWLSSCLYSKVWREPQ